MNERLSAICGPREPWLEISDDPGSLLRLRVQPIIRPCNNPGTVILRRPHLESMQAEGRIRRAEAQQVAVASMLGGFQNTFFEALVAREGGVFAAAHVGDFFRDILLEGL